jgi:hypothetical protein
VVLPGGRSGGRRLAIEAIIHANAASPEEARLCIGDLNRIGFALQSSDGKRVEPKPTRGARFRYMRFDEEEKP